MVMFEEREVRLSRDRLAELVERRGIWLVLGRDVQEDIDLWDELILMDAMGSGQVEGVVVAKDYVKQLGKWAIRVELDAEVDPVQVIRDTVGYDEEKESGEGVANAIEWTGGGVMKAGPVPGTFQVFSPSRVGSLLWDEWLIRGRR